MLWKKKYRSDQSGHCREPQAHRRDIGHHEKPYKNCNIVPEHIGHDAGKGTSPDLDGYKQGISHRRSNISDTEVVYQDQAELNRIHAKVLTTGRNRGVKIRIAGVTSIKVPAIKRMTFMISRMIMGLLVRPKRASEMA